MAYYFHGFCAREAHYEVVTLKNDRIDLSLEANSTQESFLLSLNPFTEFFDLFIQRNDELVFIIVGLTLKAQCYIVKAEIGAA